MTNTRERLLPVEIEVTPVMIEAGLVHLFNYHPEHGVDAEETVVRILRLMLPSSQEGISGS